MNETSQYDDIFPTDVDALIEEGKPLSHKIINALAQTIPQADNAFKQDLEHSLISKLTTTINTKDKPNMYTHTSHFPHIPKHLGQLLTGIISLMVIVLAGVFLFNVNYTTLPLASNATATPETPITEPIVIAARDISAGTIITPDMVQIIHLPVQELNTLRIAHPESEFFMDTLAVIGQMVAVDIFWFQPIMTISLGEVAGVCDPTTPNCPPLPDGYSQINFPLDEKMVRGLSAGDRVDVLAVINGQIHIIVEDIILMDILSEQMTLAAPSWKHSVLVWLYHSTQQYALRLHTPLPDTEADEDEDEDEALTTYQFNVPNIIPEDYHFDLVIKLPLAQGYLLVDAPASLDHLDFVEGSNMLQFIFKHIDVVEIEPLSTEAGTSLTIQLPADDVANLAYLLALGAEINFIP